MSLGSRLKQETTDLHQALHRCRFTRDLLTGSLDQRVLARLLHALLPLHRQLEQRLAVDCPLDAAWWRLSPAIAHDLNLLGPPLPPPPSPAATDFIHQVSPAELVGMTYVVAGSRLGAASLRLAVRRCWPQQVGELRFTDGPADAARHWPDVLVVLEQQCSSEPDAAAACSGARAFMQATLQIYQAVA